MVPSRPAAYHARRQMLRRLHIQNLVLIHEAELELAPGLNAITGETGAGKTILAQAIGLLLGAKAELAAARRRLDELRSGAEATQTRITELRALVEDTAGMEAEGEQRLRDERERLRHVTELAHGVAAAVEALAPDEGEGAAGLAAAA